MFRRGFQRAFKQVALNSQRKFVITGPIVVASTYWLWQEQQKFNGGGPIKSDVKAAFSLQGEVSDSIKIQVEEIRKHNKAEDLWVAIHGKVYDLTEFVMSHPGGPAIIMQFAGKDATDFFSQIHSTDIIEMLLPPEKCLGELEGSFPTIDEDEDDDDDDMPIEIKEKPKKVITTNNNNTASSNNNKRKFVKKQQNEVKAKTGTKLKDEVFSLETKPPLHNIFNISDFEYVAKKVLPIGLYSYLATGSDDEITLRNNHYAFQRVFFKPRILVDTREIDVSTEMGGVKVGLPIYITAFSTQGKLAPGGELNLTRVANKHDIIQMIPIMSSQKLSDLVAAAKQSQWCQLHFESPYDLNNAERTIQRLCSFDNVKAIFINADIAAESNREKDFKMRKFLASDEFKEMSNPDNVYPTITWEHLENFQKVSTKPLYIKGIQRPEEIVEAYRKGFRGVVISNHGGRQLDFSNAPLEVLEQAMPKLRAMPGYDKKNFDVFIDGGIRRGSDIIKALCLGATGVGLGRPFAYSLAAYGEAGSDRMMSLLRQELDRDMKLLGCNDVKKLNEKYVETSGLYNRLNNESITYNALYEPVPPPRFQNEEK